MRSSIRGLGSALALLVSVLVVSACDGPQSALDPHGPRARELAQLWWIMAAGAAVIWLFVIGCAVYATRIRPRAHEDFAGTAFILGGGVGLPLIVLSSLLIYSFLLAREPAAIPGTGLRIEAGMCFAIEPMFNLGGDEVALLDDGWTVVTADGGLSAHFENTIAVTDDGPQVLTVP